MMPEAWFVALGAAFLIFVAYAIYVDRGHK